MKNWLCILVSASFMFAMISCDDSGSNDFTEPPHNEISGADDPTDFTKADRAIRLVSYNVGLFAKYIDNSTDMVASMMKELKADAVCLNELDSCTTRTGKAYQSKVLAEKMGNWHHYFAGAMPYKGGSYGEGMVVSPEFKNVGTYTIEIPKGLGAEPRVCAVFKTDKFIFMSTHLDHVNHDARVEGANLISEWARENYGDSDIPVFLCGDMNCEPKDEPILIFKKDWKQISVTKSTYPCGPAKTPRKCIDFIFALNNKASYKVLKSDVPLLFNSGRVIEASDHLPIYVDVLLN